MHGHVCISSTWCAPAQFALMRQKRIHRTVSYPYPYPIHSQQPDIPTYVRTHTYRFERFDIGPVCKYLHHLSIPCSVWKGWEGEYYIVWGKFTHGRFAHKQGFMLFAKKCAFCYGKVNGSAAWLLDKWLLICMWEQSSHSSSTNGGSFNREATMCVMWYAFFSATFNGPLVVQSIRICKSQWVGNIIRCNNHELI